MSTKYDANNPYIKASKNANPKALAAMCFGIPILTMILALPFPFFRHIFTFSTVIVTIILCIAVGMAYEDKKNGVVRSRPTKNKFVLPKWFKPAFFLFMIAGSAGLRLGWYIVSICWLINWGCFVAFQKHMEATYKESVKKDPNDRLDPWRHLREGEKSCLKR